MRSFTHDHLRRPRASAAILALTLALSSVAAGAEGVATVNASRLNVRAKPSTGSVVLTVVQRGTALPLIEDAGNGWLKVDVNGMIGYISGQYASVSDGASGQSQESGSQGARSGVVTADRLNVRSGASAAGRVIGTVLRGKTLEIVGQNGDWLEIRYNGVPAYVSAAYVRLASGASEGNAPEASPSAPVVLTGLLSQGSRGDAVKALQERLVALGFLKGGADGVFGPATKSAVTAFQRAKGLLADGIAGAQTLAALNDESASAPTPTPSHSPQSAGETQAPSAATPTPQPSSTPAPADLLPVGTNTILKSGMSGSDVQALQRRLITLGYLTGTADGVFGPATKKALISFQKANGLTADGEAGPLTLTAIGSEGAVASTNKPKPAVTPTPDPDHPNVYDEYVYVDWVMSELIVYRDQRGLPTQISNWRMFTDINVLARARVLELYKSYSHTRPDGTTVYDASNRVVTEYIAKTKTADNRAVLAEILADEDLCEIILSDKVTAYGSACFQINGEYYWDILFGN